MTSKATVRRATHEGRFPHPRSLPTSSTWADIKPCPDVPVILQLIHELAAYERATHEVLATNESLSSTLSFPSSPNRGYAHTLLIIDPDSTVAGMALYFTNYSTWRAAPGIYLEDLFIRPAYRKRGYGKRLLGELAREVVGIGGKRLEWSVLRWNEPSIKFYESLGAKAMEEWMGMRVDGEGLEKMSEMGKGVEG